MPRAGLGELKTKDKQHVVNELERIRSLIDDLEAMLDELQLATADARVKLEADAPRRTPSPGKRMNGTEHERNH